MGLCLPWQEAHKEFRTQLQRRGVANWQTLPLSTPSSPKLYITKLPTFAHRHEVADKHGCPKTRAGMQTHNFTLEAPLRVLETIVRPADVTQLNVGECSICLLHTALAGSEVGLGCPQTMNDLRYIGGGKAISNRRLDEGAPASPAPGASLPPPVARDGRFSRRQRGATYNCDGRFNVGLHGTAGTWEDDYTRELLAQNRAQAYAEGKNCRWLCERCWAISLEKKGIPLPEPGPSERSGK
eukprot:9495813-Pyramimonas_sp.AAC.1